MSKDLSAVRRIGSENRWLAVVAVARGDGSVHASFVNAGIFRDPESGDDVVALVAAGGTRKLEHIARSGRACLTFTSGWTWASVEGPARIAGSDPTLLRDVFKAAGGTHDDWDEYDRVMAADGRVAVFVRPERVVGNG